jgi:hypothetical protein
MPLLNGWDGVNQAVSVLRNKVEGLLQEISAGNNLELQTCLNTVVESLKEGEALYKEFKEGNYTVTYFALSHAIQITDIAKRLAIMVPPRVRPEDAEFPKMYIEFLKSIKEISNPPHLPALLTPILIFKVGPTYYQEHYAKCDNHELFRMLCDDGIVLQENNIREIELKNTSSTTSLDALPQYGQMNVHSNINQKGNITQDSLYNKCK